MMYTLRPQLLALLTLLAGASPIAAPAPPAAAHVRVTRAVQDNPLFPAQWNLRNTGQPGAPGVDIDVVPAWDAGFAGDGVTIAFVDDALQHTHPEIAAGYRPDLSYDVYGGDSSPLPASSSEAHGTAEAGVAAGRDNTVCGVGVAHRAGIAGVRLVGGPVTDSQEAAALTWAAKSDVANNTWGPPDDGSSLEAPGPLARAALAAAVTGGRGGRGTVLVWSAGNGRAVGDNANFDGYANQRYVIGVGAVSHAGQQAGYSEPGSSILVVAPSEGADASGRSATITTADLTGDAGYAAGDCHQGFGGTSSAAAQVSGIVALMLQANPALTWRDVQHILVRTSRKTDPSDAGWATNGAGLPISHRYGFGLVDAWAAVQAARTWRAVPPEVTVAAPAQPVDQAIPDGSAAGVSRTVEVPQDIVLEHVELVLDADHPSRGDLRVTLTSPDGTQSILADARDDDGDDFDGWRFMTTHSWGESARGRWTLTVSDTSAGGAGRLIGWQLLLHGAEPYGLAVSSGGAQAGRSGETVAHAVQVTNAGVRPDTFDVAVSGGWPAQAPQSVGPLAPGESAEVVVRVAIPVIGAVSQTTGLTLRSRGDQAKVAERALTTVRLDARQVFLPIAGGR